MRAMRKERGAYHHGRLREALVAAALELIAEAGTQGLSLRDVARRLGVSHQAPYRHFADKQALLDAIAGDGFRELADALRATVTAHADPVDRLVELGVTYVRFARDHRAAYRVMFAEPSSAEGAPPPEPTGDTAFHVLVETIRYGQAKGAFVAGSARELAVASFAFVHGLAMLGIDGKLADRRDAATRALIGHHVRGVTRR